MIVILILFFQGFIIVSHFISNHLYKAVDCRWHHYVIMKWNNIIPETGRQNRVL